MPLEGYAWIPSHSKHLTGKVRINHRDLQAFRSVHSQIEESILKKIIHQLIHLMLFLHQEKKIAHGDIKPTNLLIDQEHHIKLIDMSTCQDISKSYISKSFRGSSFYACPNAKSGKPFDGRMNDLWALGMTLMTVVYGCKTIPKFQLNDEKVLEFVMEPTDYSLEFHSFLKNLFTLLFNQNPSRDTLYEFNSFVENDSMQEKHPKESKQRGLLKRWGLHFY